MIPVVVTGMGAVCPLGLQLAPIWEALVEGRRVRHEISLFETAGCRCRFGAQVALPEITKAERRLSRASRLALRAAEEALEQAQVYGSARRDIHISVSTNGGAMEWGEAFVREVEKSRRSIKISHVSRYQPQQQVLDLQRGLGLTGTFTIMANACASSANSIGHGYDLIRSGLAEIVLVGGYEALTELIFVGFDCLQALSPDECRPFDCERNGLMLGEGAAFMVLESDSHARRRKAPVLGRILGYGHATDLHHLTQPAPDGLALIQAMRAGLQTASLSLESIAYINAHGTATPTNDGVEAGAYAQLFGSHLPGLRVSSTKAAIGHTLGAAGALEAVFALCASKTGNLPPQLGVTHALPEIASSLVRARETIAIGLPVMSTNLGFGGCNAALILCA